MRGFSFDRRAWLRGAGRGVAAAGLASLGLPAWAEPTESSGTLGDYQLALAPGQPQAWQPTEDNILGPFYRPGSPYRAKITPPLSPGVTLLISGRVWGVDTRKPLAGAVLDIWQANKDGRYDNDDPRNPPAQGVFRNRARLVTDEQGYYEFETVHPGRYKIGPDQWRPAHIHYMVRMPGYQQLVTQLYFEGDPINATDPWIKDSLTIALEEVKVDQGVYERGMFDIVLAKA